MLLGLLDREEGYALSLSVSAVQEKCPAELPDNSRRPGVVDLYAVWHIDGMYSV